MSHGAGLWGVACTVQDLGFKVWHLFGVAEV